MESHLLEAALDPLSYPLWVLFNVAHLKELGFRGSLPVHVADDGTRFAPVFTDKALAERFLDELPEYDCELMPVESPARLMSILRVYLMGGVFYVGTDFSSRRFEEKEKCGQVQKIEFVVSQIEAVIR